MTDVLCEQTGYSHKKRRLYCRKFNYAEARERHAAGESVNALARAYGVSWGAMKRAVDPDWRRQFDAKSNAWINRGICPDCGGQSSRHKVGGDHRCRACTDLALATSVRADALQCFTCREWQPDESFPFNRAAPKARRGRHTSCRACATKLRRDYRERHKVPCENGCGTLVLPVGPERRGAVALCHPCAVRRAA